MEKFIARDFQGAVESAASSCLIFYRIQGFQQAVGCLTTLMAPFADFARVNVILVANDRSSIVHLYDTDPDGLKLSRTARPRHSVQYLDPAGSLTDVFVAPDLSVWKEQEPFCRPELRDLPFQAHESMCRIPLFATRTHVCIANLFSDRKDAFGPGLVEGLKKILLPLGRMLRDDILLEPLLRGPAARPGSAGMSAVELLEQCPSMKDVLGRIRVVAGKDTTVLLLGETGAGKEIAASAIRMLSPRADGPFIKVNCGAIPQSLAAEILFGHEKGAFTDAHAARPGLFEQADGGTLFLDEAESMSPDIQTSLLRAMEERVVTRVGGSRAIPVDVRLVVAAHPDLAGRVRAGGFRVDLWYRLAVFPISLPPLRDRKLDIPRLLDHFLRVESQKLRMDVPAVIPDAELARMMGYGWPGNIRELRAVIERSLILHSAGPRDAPLHFDLEPLLDVSAAPAGADGLASDWPALEELSDRYVRMVLEKTDGRLQGRGGAVEILGIHYTTLRAHMLRMGIPLPRAGRQA